MIAYYIISNQTNLTETTNWASSNITELKVGTQTIENTLTSSGQIISNQEETLTLNTSYYINEVYVEENQELTEGTNILQYTNGTYLTAPYDLVVTKLNVPSSGGKVSSQHGITVQNTKSLALSISIDETEMDKVATGQEVTITPNAYENITYTGTVSKINPIGTYSSNGTTFTGTVTFENDGKLKVGMSASCRIVLEKAENVVSVPIEAVQTENNTKYVIIKQEDGTTQNVTIETGISNDAYVEIKSGLNGGETIQMIKQTEESSSTRQSGGKGMAMDNGQMMDFPGGNGNGRSGSGMTFGGEQR